MEPDAADDALTCPLCGYDLRGLPEHRCPECGHAFDPVELRRAKEERRQLFFEHATARFPLAFVTTAISSFRPDRFWRRVHAAHAIVQDRLLLWGISWVAITFVFGVFMKLVTVARRGDETFAGPALVLLATILWTPSTVLATNVFGITLSRADIRAGHLWRCVLYALPMTLMVGFVGLVVIAGFRWDYEWLPRGGTFYATSRTLRTLGLHRSTGLLAITVLVATTIHLAYATASYLRLRHAIAQALLVQIMVVLGLITLFSFFALGQ